MFLGPETSHETLKRPEKAPKIHPKRHPKVVQKLVKKWLKSEPKNEQKQTFPKESFKKQYPITLFQRKLEKAIPYYTFRPVWGGKK